MDKPVKFALPSPNFNRNAKDASKPKPHFLTPSGMSLLPREKQPPPMYGKYGATMPPKLLTHIATGQEQFEEQQDKQYCEPCELELQSLEDLKRHRAQHEKCPVMGCQYKGHTSVMDKHVNTLHASGLFEKFKKFSTPEELVAWREERKKRYPTLANVLLKQKAQEQRQKRGERLEASKNRFGNVNDKKRAQTNQSDSLKEGDKVLKHEIKDKQKNNRRNRKNKKNKQSRELQSKPEVKKEIEKSNSEPVEVYCDGVKMFRGTGLMMGYKHLSEKKNLPANNVLFCLVGMYGSDDESEESEDQSNAEVKALNSEIICSNDDGNKEDERLTNNLENCENIKTDQNEKMRNNNENHFNIEHNFESSPHNKAEDEKNEIVIEKLESSTAYCKIVSENSNINHAIAETITVNLYKADLPGAINEHSSDEAPEETPIERSILEYPIKPENLTINQINEEPVTKRYKLSADHLKAKLAKRKSGLDYRKLRLRKQNTMLEKLIETDIRHERNVLLQCVRYVCENNFFGIVHTKNSKPDSK